MLEGLKVRCKIAYKRVWLEASQIPTTIHEHMTRKLQACVHVRELALTHVRVHTHTFILKLLWKESESRGRRAFLLHLSSVWTLFYIVPVALLFAQHHHLGGGTGGHLHFLHIFQAKMNNKDT